MGIQWGGFCGKRVGTSVGQGLSVWRQWKCFPRRNIADYMDSGSSDSPLWNYRILDLLAAGREEGRKGGRKEGMMVNSIIVAAPFPHRTFAVRVRVCVVRVQQA